MNLSELNVKDNLILTTLWKRNLPEGGLYSVLSEKKKKRWFEEMRSLHFTVKNFLGPKYLLCGITDCQS